MKTKSEKYQPITMVYAYSHGMLYSKPIYEDLIYQGEIKISKPEKGALLKAIWRFIVTGLKGAFEQ